MSRKDIPPNLSHHLLPSRSRQALMAKTATGLAKISELTRQKRHLDESWRVKLAKIGKWEMDFHAYFEAH